MLISELLLSLRHSATIAGVGLASLIAVVSCGFASLACYKKVVKPLVVLAQRAHLRRAPVRKKFVTILLQLKALIANKTAAQRLTTILQGWFELANLLSGQASLVDVQEAAEAAAAAAADPPPADNGGDDDDGFEEVRSDFKKPLTSLTAI